MSSCLIGKREWHQHSMEVSLIHLLSFQSKEVEGMELCEILGKKKPAHYLTWPSQEAVFEASCKREPAPRPRSLDRCSHGRAKVSLGWVVALASVTAPCNGNPTGLELNTHHPCTNASIARISTLLSLYTFNSHFSNVQPHWDVRLRGPGNHLRYQLLLLLVATKLCRFWEICPNLICSRKILL